MTRKQQALYFRRWGAARRALRAAGLPPADADAWRKRIHRDVTGYECSSRDLTNRDLDSVFACFVALSAADDAEFQARQLDQPMARLRWLIIQCAASLGKPPSYAEAIAQRMHKRPLDLCDEPQLTGVLAALTTHKRRQHKNIAQSGPVPAGAQQSKPAPADQASGTPSPQPEPENCPF